MLYDSVEYTIQQQQSINMIDRIASSCNGSQVFQHSEPLQCYYYFEWTNTDSYTRIEAL